MKLDFTKIAIDDSEKASTIHNEFMKYYPDITNDASDIYKRTQEIDKIFSLLDRIVSKQLLDTKKKEFEMVRDDYIQYDNHDGTRNLAAFYRFLVNQTYLFTPPTAAEKDAVLVPESPVNPLDSQSQVPFPAVSIDNDDCIEKSSSDSEEPDSVLILALRLLAPKLSENKFIQGLLGSVENTTLMTYKNASKFSFAWHKHRNMFAVIDTEATGKVHIYDYDENGWKPEPLVHEFQKLVTCLAWQPQGTSLAVASKYGVCFWELRKQAWWMSFIPSNDGQVTSLSFSPTGQFLAFTSFKGVTVVDISNRKRIVLLENRQVSRVSWSPNGLYVLAIIPREGFRIFEASSWKSEMWYYEDIATGIWTADGKDIVVARCTDYTSMTISVIHLPHSPPDIDASLIPVELDLAEASQSMLFSDTSSGTVEDIAVDSSGQRLAVRFQGARGVALYMIKPEFSGFYLLGFVVGPLGSIPDTMEFKPMFVAGSMLSVIFINGHTRTLRNVPLYF